TDAKTEDLILLSRAHFLMGEYFSNHIESEELRQWNLSSQWAEKALALNPEFKEKVVVQKNPPEQALDSLTERDGDALYWFAFSLNRWANAQGVSTELQYKDRIKKMMARVAQLNPGISHGGIY